MIKHLLDNGYYHTVDKESFRFIDIHSVEWTNKGTIPLQMCVRTPDTQAALKKTQQWLGEKYIRPAFGDYHSDYVDLVNGMDENVFDWHNDYEEGKVNLGILLYFTDTDEETGSGIGFRRPFTTESTGFFYPKKDDVCVINHTTNFEHRVTKQNMPLPRIVASFHYYVNALN